MNNLLITGGSGFFGQNLVKAFPHALAPSHKELDLLDIHAVESYVKNHKIQCIIHGATAVGTNYFEPTIMMFRSIMHVAPLVKKVIYYGSGAEYGKDRDLIRVKEREFGTYIPKDQNGLSKYINCLLATQNTYVLRVFGVYGPHENYRHKFISNTIVKHMLGMPIVIKQDAIFDYLWIEDLVEITKKILHATPRHRLYNCTPDESIHLTEIAKMISGFSVLTPGLNYQYTGDNSLLKKEFPMRFTSYEEGINKLQKYYSTVEVDKKIMQEDAYLKNAQAKL